MVSVSVGLAGAQEFAFLTSSQDVGSHHTLRTTALLYQTSASLLHFPNCPAPRLLLLTLTREAHHFPDKTGPASPISSNLFFISHFPLPTWSYRYLPLSLPLFPHVKVFCSRSVFLNVDSITCAPLRTYLTAYTSMQNNHDLYTIKIQLYFHVFFSFYIYSVEESLSSTSTSTKIQTVLWLFWSFVGSIEINYSKSLTEYPLNNNIVLNNNQNWTLSQAEFTYCRQMGLLPSSKGM